MRALLVGATGGTGLEVIRQAPGRGVDITALVRSPDKLGDLAASANVVTGDVFDVDQLAQAAGTCDAAICTIGAPAGFLGRGATTVYSRAAAALTEALGRAGVTRLVFCTSAGVEPHDPGELLPYRLIAKPLFLQRAYDDMIIAEATIRRSTLDWTLVRPGRLVDQPGTGTYRVSPRYRPPGQTSIPRADVASFLLDQLADTGWSRRTPTLAT